MRGALPPKGAPVSADAKVSEVLARVERGGAPKYHQKNAENGKLFARDRIGKLVDAGSFVEDAALANNLESDLPRARRLRATSTAPTST
jgi:methylmalonyl-CoA decarboxylase subunit alpha